MKTQCIPEQTDIATIRRARDLAWEAYCGFYVDNMDPGFSEMKMLLNVKRLLDELLLEDMG